jgi:hypothetical protein
MGGLGNQLFQIFTVLSYAREHQIESVFTGKDWLIIGAKRPTYWNTLLSRLKHLTRNSLPSFELVYREPHFHYHPIPSALAQHSVQLNGYFQSHRYFESHYDAIVEEIDLAFQREQVRDKYRDRYFDSGPVVSIHFRIGDYQSKQAYHPVLSNQYYQLALKRLLGRCQETGQSVPTSVLYFYQKGDQNQVDMQIGQLKVSWPDLSFVAIDHGVPDWEQLLVMSLCQHHVIANSTFSWWGAYFNPSRSKVVCYPVRWFGPKFRGHRLGDLFPDDWLGIE